MYTLRPIAPTADSRSDHAPDLRETSRQPPSTSSATPRPAAIAHTPSTGHGSGPRTSTSASSSAPVPPVAGTRS